MLFVLDNDVDVAVAGVVRRAGHRCETVERLGMAEASDDEVSVWADSRGAVVVTHDKEFFRRREANTFGRHVRLACREREAVSVMERHFDKIVDLAQSREAVVILATPQSVDLRPTKWQ